MTPSDVAGVFSRYFIVGFFVPAFFALAVLAFGLSDDTLPNAFEGYSAGAQIAIVGAVALLIGLALLGVNYQLLRVFEGYPLVKRKEKDWVKPLHDWLIERQRRRYDRLVALSDQVGPEGDEAAWLLDRYFSEDPRKRLLPTAFGNAVRAFERHSLTRWGLDGVAVWPRIEMLMDEQQREIEADARGGVGFFVNGALLALIAGVTLLADLIINRETAWYLVWLYVLPFGLAYAAYRGSIGAAIGWGSSVRAAIDLTRLTLYDELGVRRPLNFEDERQAVAPAVSRCFLYAEPLSGELWGEPSAKEEEEEE